MLNRLKLIKRKIVVLSAVGAVLSLFLQRKNYIYDERVILSDMFFMIAICFMLTALAEIVSNSGFFNSLVFGTKHLLRLIQNRLDPSDEVKDEYVEYIRNRQMYNDINILLSISLALFLVSVIIA